LLVCQAAAAVDDDCDDDDDDDLLLLIPVCLYVLPLPFCFFDTHTLIFQMAERCPIKII